MKKFWIDYSASIVIEAEDEDAAREIFYNGEVDFNKLEFVEIDGVEEDKE